jgi:glycosyltransferase involved in cell wall biosynthesis
MTQGESAMPIAEQQSPVISVLMAAYNCEAFIAEAIASIQRQTVSNIEMIVVNDGSTDGTLRIIESIASTDSRVRVINMPGNGGCVAAWNHGLDHCRAPYIARMDADDIAIENRLEKQLLFLERHPEIALVGGAVLTIDSQGKLIDLGGPSLIPLSQHAIARTLLLGTPCYHPCWFARRELYAALQGYRALVACEDYDFLLRAVTSGYKLANLPDVVMKLRKLPGQASSQLRNWKMHRYVIRLYRERAQRQQDSFNPEAAREIARSGRFAGRLHHLSVACLNRGFQSRRKWIKFFFLAAAALLSPWQARYFLDRLRARRICRSALDGGA